MTPLDGQAVRHWLTLRARQIENLCAAVTSEILILTVLHGVIQLECNLSGPRTGLRVHREQMSQQLRRLVVSTALHALGAKTCHHLRISPETDKVT